VPPTLRWYIKKASRKGVATVYGAKVLLERAVGLRAKCARLLTYHRFGESHGDAFCVSPHEFERQVAMLARQGRAVSLQDLISHVSKEREIPQDACLITIDDGMLSTLTHALPILEKWKVPAVAFVSSGLVGKSIPDMPERYMGWDELRQLIASGLVEVGSHAHTHRSLGNMGLEDARFEARISKETLEENLGVPIRCFAYPFGTKGDFSSATDSALREAGYEIAFNSMHGAIRRDMPRFSLPRVKIEGGEGLLWFSLISRGALDAWRIVDNNLWRLQRVRKEVA
jgi:peptidoglycan/xylan/chitin deacetylase (PgdA/CDA1 family)